MEKRGQYSGPLPRASPAGGISGELFGPIVGVLGKLLRFLGIIIIIAIVFVVFFVGTRYFLFKQQTGELASTVTHATVAGEEALKANAPGLYYIIYPENYNPYAIDSTVEYTEATKDLGVKIKEFHLSGNRRFFNLDEDIELEAKIDAGAFPDSSYDLEVFCLLDDAKIPQVPARLFGPNANGNKGTIAKGLSTQFIVNCNFPGGITIKNPTPELREVAKEAKLIVTYNFKTKAYARMWFLNKAALFDFQTRSIDPFKQYGINDPLLDSDKNAVPKQTPGPINLGLNIPFPQPFTTAEYKLFVKLSRTLGEGNLQTLEYLSIKVPSVTNLIIVLKGEGGYTSQAGRCDFEFIGEEGGYKEYKLVNNKLTETNRDCGKQTLKELALTETDCISIFKEHVFNCDFAVTRVPETRLQSDIITSEAQYTMKVQKKTVATVRILPQQPLVA